jgi:predicted PurR-regulated permease PerM
VALVVVGAAVVLITLYLGREALTPFIVGLLIVYLLAPPVERPTERAFRGRSRSWSSISSRHSC